MRRLAILVALALLPAPALGQETDWAALLRVDAQGLHDDIAANHAGPVNSLDPDFAARNDAQLAFALERANDVRSFAGYRAAMAYYASSFNDGHIFWGTNDKAPSTRGNWPGFLTAFDEAGQQTVQLRADDSPVPLGATLLNCDGMAADVLAARLLGDFVGRWTLASQRKGLGNMLFLDIGNPFVKRPERCTFQVDGREQQFDLRWRPFDFAQLNKFADPPREPIAERVFPDGTRWFSLSSFNGDPGSTAGKALTALIARMQDERALLSAAPRIVLDLRRNGGGSSDWSYRMAKILWGPAQTEEAAQDNAFAEWRASPANIDYIIEQSDKRAASGDLPPDLLAYFDQLITGMRTAHAAGRQLWREPDDAYEPRSSVPDKTPPAFAGPVFLVTDEGCASACLDAVDLWRRLGAIHVGRETSADTLYLDIRRDTLPSGISSVSVPMKVWRNRLRGDNEPVVPIHRYAGSLSDTNALEAWIAGLRMEAEGIVTAPLPGGPAAKSGVALTN